MVQWLSKKDFQPSEDPSSVHVARSHAATAQCCSGGSLAELLQHSDKLISPVKKSVNQQRLLAQVWYFWNLDILLLDLCWFTNSQPGFCLHGEDVSAASCQCFNCTFSKSLDQSYYLVLCFLVGGLLQTSQANSSICFLWQSKAVSNYTRIHISYVWLAVQFLQEFFFVDSFPTI